MRAALAWRGRGAVEEERRGDSRNKITHEEGGEATGAFATQSSGSSKLVGRRVVCPATNSPVKAPEKPCLLSPGRRPSSRTAAMSPLSATLAQTAALPLPGTKRGV